MFISIVNLALSLLLDGFRTIWVSEITKNDDGVWIWSTSNHAVDSTLFTETSFNPGSSKCVKFSISLENSLLKTLLGHENCNNANDVVDGVICQTKLC